MNGSRMDLLDVLTCAGFLLGNVAVLVGENRRLRGW